MEEAVANLLQFEKQLCPQGMLCGVPDQRCLVMEREEEVRTTPNATSGEFLPTEQVLAHSQPDNSESGQQCSIVGIEDAENICAPESSKNCRSKRIKKPQGNKNKKEDARQCLLELHNNMQEKMFKEISHTMTSMKRKNEREDELFQTDMKIKKIELEIKKRQLETLNQR